MFSFLRALIVEGIIGVITGAILGKDVPGSIIGNTIVGFLGNWVASPSLSSLEPVIGSFPIISTLLGAIICIVICSFTVNRKTQNCVEMISWKASQNL